MSDDGIWSLVWSFASSKFESQCCLLLALWLKASHLTFLFTAAEYTFFRSAHRTLSSMDHVLGHKRNLKFRKVEIISGIFS